MLAWGDTQSFPRLGDKQILTSLVDVKEVSQGELERGVVPEEVTSELSSKGHGLSSRATVTTVTEGREWLIIDPHQEIVVVRQGETLNVGRGLLSLGSAQYQGGLDEGVVGDGLREQFRLNNLSLSELARVFTIEEDRSWLISDPRKQYRVVKKNYLDVGGVALQVDPETQADMDRGIVSEDVKYEFWLAQIGLSDSATISPLKPGSSWLVDDPALNARHTVATGDSRLYVDEIEDKEVFLNEDIAGGVDVGTEFVTREGRVVFDFIGSVIKKVLAWIQDALLWLPYPVLIGSVSLLAWRMAGFAVGLFSTASLLMIGLVGLWPSAMETLSLMVTSVAVSTLIAMPIGIVAARNNAVDTALRPLLDGMQTMPSFVYLVPAIFFFGLGNVPAVIATIIYAVPPAIRLTNLGIRQVSPDTLEAARAFGATPTQLLFKVQMPLALPTIMAGINQTTMMALAMVVVASLVGAGGLGEDVLRAIGRLQIGNSLLAGLSIVFLAIILDRITQGFARAQERATQQ